MEGKKCEWFGMCILKSYRKDTCSSEDDVKEDCDMFKYIAKKIAEFYAKIKENLEKGGLFSYDEPWYKKIKGDLISRGTIITKKGFEEIEDKIIEEFLKNKGAQK